MPIGISGYYLVEKYKNIFELFDENGNCINTIPSIFKRGYCDSLCKIVNYDCWIGARQEYFIELYKLSIGDKSFSIYEDYGVSGGIIIGCTNLHFRPNDIIHLVGDYILVGNHYIYNRKDQLLYEDSDTFSFERLGEYHYCIYHNGCSEVLDENLNFIFTTDKGHIVEWGESIYYISNYNDIHNLFCYEIETSRYLYSCPVTLRNQAKLGFNMMVSNDGKLLLMR